MKSMLLARSGPCGWGQGPGAQAATDGWYGAVDIGYSLPFKVGTTSGTASTGYNPESIGMGNDGTADVRVGYKFDGNGVLKAKSIIATIQNSHDQHQREHQPRSGGRQRFGPDRPGQRHL